jgi:2-(1,2-epoxy-1,2-dihydrophenyl)acetyl-CoA isomerase
LSPALESVSLDVRDGVARLQIERPERMNALDRHTYGALREQLERLAEDAGVRVIVLSGSGRAFCAGADLKARAEDPAAADVEQTLRAWANPLIRAIRAAPQPIVAALNGPAIGIGCSLALACDLIVAADAAYLSLPFTRIGLAPDGGAVVLACARAGKGRVTEMLLLGNRVPAKQAHEWGLVDRVVPADRLAEEVERLAASIAGGSPQALAAAKRTLDAPTAEALERELELEATLQGELASSRDHAEALAAFAERRTPRFTGA